jgi:hypothetical protein
MQRTTDSVEHPRLIQQRRRHGKQGKDNEDGHNHPRRDAIHDGCARDMLSFRETGTTRAASLAEIREDGMDFRWSSLCGKRPRNDVDQRGDKRQCKYREWTATSRPSSAPPWHFESWACSRISIYRAFGCDIPVHLREKIARPATTAWHMRSLTCLPLYSRNGPRGGRHVAPERQPGSPR